MNGKRPDPVLAFEPIVNNGRTGRLGRKRNQSRGRAADQRQHTQPAANQHLAVASAMKGLQP
jgi:hypothetical protein